LVSAPFNQQYFHEQVSAASILRGAQAMVDLHQCPLFPTAYEKSFEFKGAFHHGAEDYSPDAKNIIISLATKYSNVERKYSVPIECLSHC
jgi:hypothetical protein